MTGPTVKVGNKTTGEMIDTGMETGKLTEEAKIELQNYGRIEAAKQMGANAANVAGIRQRITVRDESGNVYYIDPNASTDPNMGITSATPGAPPYPRGRTTPMNTGGGAGAAANPRVDRNNRFQQLADERPDLAQKWLIPPVSSTGNWGMKPPPQGRDGWFWDTPVNATEMAEYNQVREALGLPPMPTPAQQPAQQAPPVQQQGNQPIGPRTVPQVPQAAAPRAAAPDPFTQTPVEQDPFAQPPIQPGQNLGGGIGSIMPAIRGSLRPPIGAGQNIPNEPDPNAPAQTGVGPQGQPLVSEQGEILIKDLQTGRVFYMRPENLPKAIATKRYQVVQ